MIVLLILLAIVVAQGILIYAIRHDVEALDGTAHGQPTRHLRTVSLVGERIPDLRPAGIQDLIKSGADSKNTPFTLVLILSSTCTLCKSLARVIASMADSLHENLIPEIYCVGTTSDCDKHIQTGDKRLPVISISQSDLDNIRPSAVPCALLLDRNRTVLRTEYPETSQAFGRFLETTVVEEIRGSENISESETVSSPIHSQLQTHSGRP